MKNLTRRQFVQQMMIGGLTLPVLMQSLSRQLSAQSEIERQSMIWLQGHTSGMQQAGIFSHPDFEQYLEKYFQVLSWNQSNVDSDIPKLNLSNEKPFLILEGLFSKPPFFTKAAEILESYISNARAVILVGNEASYGLFNQGNHFDLIEEFLKDNETPYFILPGSPVQIKQLLGVLNHLYIYGIPELDELRRPTMFFSELVCDRCEFRGDFDQGNFVRFFGEKMGCLYLLGCKGRVTKNSCPVEGRNGTNNWCVQSGSPCTGCSEPGYPYHEGMGLFGQTATGNEDLPPSWFRNSRSIAKGIFAITTAGIIVHAMTDSTQNKLKEEDLNAYYGEGESK